MGQVFSPLDEELGLLPGPLAPRQQDHLVHLASWMPFAWAARMLVCLVQVQVSEETVRRLSEQAGAAVEAAQTAQAYAPWQEESHAQTRPARLVISADGACVPLLKGEWAEVRTAAFGEVKEPGTGTEQPEVQVTQLSYFSRLSDAATFGEVVEVEMRRRAVIQAERVCAVTDGADWLQGVIDLPRPDALRIRDFPHAAEHLAKGVEAAEKAGLCFPPQMLKRCLHLLKHRGPSLLLRMADRLPQTLSDQAGIREHLGYLRKRAALLQDPYFQQQGWPIGSGMVESANKLVVEARLKGAGMHWERKNVTPMLALRTGVCNERWQETWQVAGAQARERLALRRTKRAEVRCVARLLRCTPALQPCPTLPPQPRHPPQAEQVGGLPSAPAATLPGSSRPSAHHPWKRGPACVPKRFAKT